ncbi:MAG: gliding motility-associated C-terminal domain-containing protein [Paludibacter sp.]|nr:gliding motility-associated C-terminal domain-containing protein [Paludibacter sp.]
MKKNLLTVCFLFFTIGIFAQLKVSGNYLTLKKDSVKVIIFDSISSNSSIEYSGTNVRFYEYQDINTNKYSTALYQLDDAKGYIIEEDGISVDTIWVIDYQKYIHAFNSIEAEFNPTDQCENLNVSFNLNPLTYKTPSATPHYLPRNFKVRYQTLTWSDSWSTINMDTTITLTYPVTSISFPAPLCDTYYTIVEDNIASELGLENVTFTGLNKYSAVAIKTNLTSVVTTRAETNEAERPSTASQISGSAPMEIQFLSHANEPVAKYYNWSIYKSSEMIINRTDKDLRYTFDVYGTYTVKLVVTNEYCSYTDSIIITVSESKLEVPNVFTPNGDEYNDEFRVAFKSIIKFDCWVYSRWGRLVFHWTDPTKGWDGKINGKEATPGPYFYVIKAYGSDYDVNSEPNKVTKKRVGEWVLKGDINLLRGR